MIGNSDMGWFDMEMGGSVDKAVVKGFEKEWRKLKRKYGISSKYSDEIWDALDVGNEQKVRVMVGNALDELNGFAGKLVRAEIKTEYWRAKKEKILEDVRELIEYYEGILEGDGDGDSEDR